MSDEERAGIEASATAEFRKAAEKDFGWGQIEYGWRLREGKGAPANPAEAETLFKAAQARGMPAAAHALGRLYLGGEVASPMNPDEAFAMIRRAADQGDAGAQFFMAEKLVENWDLKPDYDAALTYYIKAAAADEGDVSWRAQSLIEDTKRRVEKEKAKQDSSPPESETAPAPT